MYLVQEKSRKAMNGHYMKAIEILHLYKYEYTYYADKQNIFIYLALPHLPPPYSVGSGTPSS